MSKARELANLRGTPTDSNILLQSTAGDAITAGSGTCNIAMGLNAFGAATTGDDNIAIGRLAIGLVLQLELVILVLVFLHCLL